MRHGNSGDGQPTETGHLLMTLNEAIAESFVTPATEHARDADAAQTLESQHGTCRDFAC